MIREPLGVLIVHGFTSSLDCVRPIWNGLEPLGLPMRMPVLRGHGASSPEALRGVRWQDWVADAETALQDLLIEAERAVIVGHSMGGLVAIALAADHAGSGIVDAMVLAAPAIQIESPLAPGRLFSFLAPLVTKLLKRWDMPPNYADKSLEMYDTNYAWAPMDAVEQLLAFSEAARRRLPQVTAPMLILQSRKDTAVAPESAEIAYRESATPPTQKRIIWFEETGHEMFRDCEREAVTQAVVDFVRTRIGTPEPAAAGPMDCRVGCGACCIAPSISSPIPGMPDGKPAGVRCVQLTPDNRCKLFGRPERPAVCVRLRPSPEMCGTSAEEAMANLIALELATLPGE